MSRPLFAADSALFARVTSRYLRNPWGLNCSVGFPDDDSVYFGCCKVAAQYYRNDRFLFSFDDTLDSTSEFVKYQNRWRIKITENKTSAAARLNYARGFPMVYNKGPKVGQVNTRPCRRQLRRRPALTS